MIRLSFLPIVLLLFLTPSLSEAGPKKLFPLPRGPFLEKCPCGPDSVRGPIRLLLMQGFRGADFREACRKHDACYDTIGACRKRCDDEFLKALLAECRNSKNPKRCERKARRYHRLVERFGEGAFQSAQDLARSQGK
ncbi:MAG: hypothetical protein P1U85_17460 [Verrucomicrobiales bacterium]|nr:hypothetical protein [Verrucomicrobiales bacterium]